ncbi:TIGR03087 family PEP-CTERM/XrtA system glycosyltransferase [uncultured Erythrobacter sp.]|uniref:TIGR03087 family PEP-CTERM/XrtA system glycosyltransferase n=1 Tax=uncultured Erythrobacter sp. TaxID=263913 RepID=UPI00262E1182|nr:TIGR03087 family PEP-CTERM/XrtA system glycosyltransferase [uncultured Erythrobacter sp.]
MGDILFFAHRVPFPPNRGDKIRAHHLLKKLAQIGRVHVGCFAESDEDRAGESELSQIAATHCIVNRNKPLVLAGVEAVLAGKPVSLTAFHSARLEKWVRDTLVRQNIDAIVIFSGQMGQYVPEDFAGCVVIDLCDVDSAKFENYAEGGERVWLNSREGRLLAKEEERLARRADATILISDAEAALFRKRLQVPSMADVQVIGNGIDAAFFDPDAVVPHPVLAGTEGPHFTFTGQMDYRPNEQAVLWAIEHLLPALRERYADAHFHVVGRNPTAALKAHKDTEGVTIWGEVPDVRPFIVGADCVLAPLLIARGVQNKVLEAMAMARPVLLTPEAATGITAVDDEHWMVSTADAQAMLARFDAIWTDRNSAERMGETAREFVLTNHAWDAMLSPLDQLVTATPNETRDAA